MLASTAFYAPIQALQSMTQRLIEIDSLITDIARVMDVPDFKLTELLEESVIVSDELSSKLKDVLTIVGEFARMGDYSNSELIDMASTAQVLQNISDLDAKGAVDTLTSAMLNFNIAASESITIADKLNEVDNNFAISTKDLSDGIRRAASTAKTFGVDINELTGYIAAIGSTTRESGSVIGNGLKTIISRITTMSEAETALNGVNISIEDMAGNVRPVSDILGELAGKWTTLSDEQRQNLGVTLAGRYQLSRFLALMNNFSLATDATNTALNSQGSSMSEQARYAESLEARINRLDTAWNNFTLSAGEAVLTDGLITTVEILNDLLTLSSTVIDKIGVLSGVFGTLGVTIFALSTRFRTFVTALAVTPASMTATSLATVGLTATMTRAQVATIGLTTAFRGLLIATGVGAAFAVVGIAVERLISAYSNAKQQQEEFEQSQQANIDALTSNKQQTEELIARYKELSAERPEGGFADTSKEQEYLQLMTQISQVYPALVGHIDATGQARLKTNDQIEEEIRLTKELIEAKKDEVRIKAEDTIKKQLDEQKELQKQIEEARKQQKQWEEYNPLFDKEDANKTKQIEAAELESQIRGLEIQISNSSLKINDEVLKISQAFNTLDIDPSIQKEITSLVSSMDLSDLNATELEAYATQLGNLSDEMQRAYESENSSGFDKAKQDILDLAKNMGATNAQLSEFEISYDKTKEASEQLANATYEEAGANDVLSDSIEGVTDAQEEKIELSQQLIGTTSQELSSTRELIALYSSLSAQESLSAEQKETLRSAYEQLATIYPHLASGGKMHIESMEKEVEQSDIMLQAIDKLASGQLSAEEQMTLNAAIGVKNRITLLKDMINAYKQASDALYTMAKERADDPFLETQDGMTAYKFGMEARNMESDVLADITEKLDEYTSSLSNAVDYNGQYYKSAENVKKAAEEQSKEMERQIYIANKLQLRLDEINTSLERQKILQGQLTNYSSKYRQSIKDEIKLLESKVKVLKDQRNEINQQIKSGNVTQYGVQTVSPSSSGSNYSSSSTSGTYGGKYASYINQAAQKYGVNPFLIAAIIQQESGFNPKAVSSAGARGLMQLMPGTASGLGVTNSFDPYQNIMGGTKYISQQLKAFGNDLSKALAAYNAGPGNVRKYGGIPPFKETQNYVNKVLGNFNKLAGSASNIATTFSSASQSVVDYYNSNFRTTSKFGQQESFRSSAHKGLDLANGKQGDPVKSLRAGKVITAAYSKTAGYWVVVQQDDGTVAKYMHLQKGLNVKAGQTVSSGQTLGKVGNTGRSTGAHLHLQIEQNGKAIDPQAYMNQLSSVGGSVSSSAADAQQALDNARGTSQGLYNDIMSAQAEIQQLQMALVESRIAYYQREQSLTEDNLAAAEAQITKESVGSKQWAKAMEDRRKITSRQVYLQKEQVNYLMQQIKYNKALTSEQKLQLNDMLTEANTQYQQMRQAFLELQMDMINSRVENYQREQSLLQDSIDLAEYSISRQKELSKEWNNEMMKKQDILQQQLVLQYKQIKYLRDQIKYNKDLSASQKDQLEDMLTEANSQYYSIKQNIASLNNDFRTAYETLGDEIVELYKEAYEKQRDAALQAIDDELKAYEKAHDEKLKMMEKEREEKAYQNDLDDRQEEIAMLKEERDLLSMDDSREARARLAEIQKELTDREKDLQDFFDDREYDIRREELDNSLESERDRLEKEREEVNDYYEKFLNDERKFAQIRKDILVGNFDAISKDLKYFAQNAANNMKYLGETIATTFIDSIGKARSALAEANDQFQQRAVIKNDTNLLTRDNKGNWVYKRRLSTGESYGITGYSSANGGMYKLGSGDLWVKAEDIDLKMSSFDTGGYTGAFGSSSQGKLAMLHEKELVLNKSDTSNFLKAIEITRSFANMIPKFQIPKLNNSSSTQQPTNNVTLNVSIDKVTGGQKGADEFLKGLGDKLRNKGVVFNV